jgi:pyruvate dehydrogenase E2 component (dihydrolipoamide acetyltransferase)
MAIPITVPRLGWNMDQGVFVGWLKAEGAAVRAGQALFTLESDKATEDIEGFDDGVLHIPAGGPSKGDVVAVGAVIGFLLQPGELIPASLPRQRGEELRGKCRAAAGEQQHRTRRAFKLVVCVSAPALRRIRVRVELPTSSGDASHAAYSELDLDGPDPCRPADCIAAGVCPGEEGPAAHRAGRGRIVQ